MGEAACSSPSPLCRWLLRGQVAFFELLFRARALALIRISCNENAREAPADGVFSGPFRCGAFHCIACSPGGDVGRGGGGYCWLGNGGSGGFSFRADFA